MTSLGLETGVPQVWPSARGRRSSIAAQFGEDLAFNATVWFSVVCQSVLTRP